MNQTEFDKLYFKAKLIGIDGLGELLLQLMKNKEERFAMQLFQLHNGQYDKLLCNQAVSEERPCKKSPYAYCFCVPFGQHSEHTNPESIYCIWCENIFSVDMTDSEIKYAYDNTITQMVNDLVKKTGL